MQKKRRHPAVQAGFTLIELMIVVVIILILAGVAYYGYRKWIDKAKTSEASLNLKAIYTGAIAFFDEEHVLDPTSMQPVSRQLPTPAVTPVADGQCCAMGGANPKCAPDATLWQGAPWTQIKFAMDQAHYYAYGYFTTSTTPTTGTTTAIDDVFIATAQGDLDCDGTRTYFQLGATVTADGIQSSGATLEFTEGETPTQGI